MPILTAVHPLRQGRGGRRPSSVDAAVAGDERSIPSRCTDDSECDMTPPTSWSPVLRRWGSHSLGQVLLEVCHD